MVPATPTQNALEIERVLVQGDIGKMPPEMRLEYYRTTCESLGLNPLTKPFEYLTLQGKTILYAKKDATDQLRKIHGVSINIVSREVLEGVYIVTARGTDKHGRQDESIGALPLPASPVERANAIMKCETKAKRRVTLSICGLGMLDETELETIGSKEAQQEYLRSKGIEPAGQRRNTPVEEEAERKRVAVHHALPDVRTASEQHKALIVETAKMLDDPPSLSNSMGLTGGTKPIEMRHAATVAEADAQLKDVAKPAKARKITADSIEIRKGFATMKEMILTVTGTTDIYYDVLRSHGYKSSADIPTKEEGRKIYLQMGSIHKGLAEEKKLRAELYHAEATYGTDAFIGVLEKHHCVDLDDVMNLTGDQLGALRADLKRLGGAA